MSQGPLTGAELEWLDEIFSQYDNDHSVIDVSELDGYLTAVLSGPRTLEPEQWLVGIWGGATKVPAWRTEREMARFMTLTFKHFADIDQRLSHYPDQFAPLLGVQEMEGQQFTLLDDWCYGYLRGSRLALWPSIEPESAAAASFQLIALHGDPDNRAQVDLLSPEQFEQHIAELSQAALNLHQYWLPDAQRVIQPHRTEHKPGRNDACLCGSGKKYKQCCLH